MPRWMLLRLYLSHWYQIEMQLDNINKLVQEPWLCSGEGFIPPLVVLPNGNTLDLLSAQPKSIVEVLCPIVQRLKLGYHS